MILGFEVQQLYLDFDIIYDRPFLRKKKDIQERLLFTLLDTKECLSGNVRLSLSYGYLCLTTETT